MEFLTRRIEQWQLRPLLGALVVATIGGAIFWYLRMPLAWMLGAMTACGVAAVLQLPINASPKIGRPMAAVIGTMLGTSFTPDVVPQLQGWILPLLTLSLFLAVAGGVVFFYLRKLTKMDGVTAYYSAMPGGLVDMIHMGTEKGGDGPTIALMHSARIFLVVFFFPILIQFVAGVDLTGRSATYRPLGDLSIDIVFWFAVAAVGGFFVGKILRLPAYHIMGPMLASAMLHLSGVTDFILPTAAVATAQVVLGMTIGCRFIGTTPKNILRVLGISIGATLLLLVLTIIFAYVLTMLSDIPIAAILLAYAPGGLAEMSLVALSLGLEVPFIAVHHFARIILVVAGAAMVRRWLSD